MPANLTPLVVALEAPVNPDIYVLHVRRHLTDEMADKYNRTTMTRAPQLVRPFFGFQPISEVHVMRHRLRFRTYKKEYDWSLFRDYLLERVVPEVFGAVEVKTLPAGPLRRSYSLSIRFEDPLVVEGLAVSRVHPFTKAVFAIEGVAELVCRRQELVLKRSPLYSFEELEAQLQPLLESSS